ncbi:5-oxoprolinase subunit PxpA [Dokdonella sp.]|uniref:5-oxoprolinase subunit PxpA n=1 Tax=Dokdonella sp. TaxID=2291710 RepID=UPI0035296DC2
MQRRIDFNCDLGEGCGNDAAIMPYISSANVACAAHAGDESSMRSTLRLCRQFKVSAGAHPGFADREHFGRLERTWTAREIRTLISEQLVRLAEIAGQEGVRLVHMKPHGALYNQAARDPELASVVAEAVRDFDAGMILVGLAGSELPRAGEAAGLRVLHEAFADRRYLDDGSLAPRSLQGSVVAKHADAIEQARSIVLRNCVSTLDGNSLALQADSICLHGDRDDAAEFARRLHQALVEADVTIQAPQLD